MRARAIIIGTAVLVGGIPALAGPLPAAEKGTKAGPAKAAARPAPAREEGLPRFAAELDLTPAQKQKIKALTKAFEAKVKAVNADKSLTPRQRHERLDPANRQMSEQIMAVLTPPQRAKERAAAQRLAAEHQKRREAAVARELGLTPAQQGKIKAIGKSYEPKFKAIGENKSLTPRQKREKMRPLVEEAEKKMDAVLTPQQRAKIEAKRKQQTEQRRQFEERQRTGAMTRRPPAQTRRPARTGAPPSPADY